MKRFTWKPGTAGICGAKEGSRIARARIRQPLPTEKLHGHDTVEYYMFLSGKARMEIDGKRITVKANEIIMAEPGEQHRILEVLEELDYITIRHA